MERLARVRRAAIVLAALAALWVPWVVLGGGVGFRIGPITVSSRRPRNAILIALLSTIVAWLLAPRGGRAKAIHDDLQRLGTALRRWTRNGWRAWTRIDGWMVSHASARAAAAVTVGVAAVVVFVGFREGAHVAAASDAWGYVSEAELWARGNLRVEQPLMRELSREIPAEALAPLAYRPSPDRTTIVPVVAPGLPMLMAVFRIAGGRDAVFVVVPLLAALAVAATYLIGRQLAGPWSGAAAAVLLAASPSFLFQLTSAPMSDVPATAWWGLSLGMLLIDRPRAALAAGLAAGAAILTRSNLAPLAIIPAAFLLWRDRRVHLPLFLSGVVAACLVIASLNTYWYGSPLTSGYGALDEIYDWRHVRPNLERYPRWVLESQGPLVLIGLVAPWLLRLPERLHGVPWARRASAQMLAAFIVGVLACYLVYVPFDAWWFLRFLLPAYPPLLALTAAGVMAIAVRMPAGLRIGVAAAAIALTVWHGVTYATEHATFHSEGEWKYAIAGTYVAEHLPDRAVLLSIQHSGSARYYSGRTTVRWDWIPPEKLEWTLTEIRRLGHVPYALIEDWEEPAIRERFAGHPVLARFDRAPLIELPLGNVRIYDLD